jgi:hypothetical protein
MLAAPFQTRKKDMLRPKHLSNFLLYAVVGMGLIPVLTACAGTPNAPLSNTSRLHANHVPDGSLRLGQVVQIATREHVIQDDFLSNALNVAGVPGEQIRDGSLVGVRVFCCGGPNEETSAQIVYVPRRYQVGLGDIVEFWSDQLVGEGEAVKVLPNTVTEVRQTADSAHKACRWEPDAPGRWMRVLYCDGMQSEGWVQQGGLYPVWVNPIASPVPPN